MATNARTGDSSPFPPNGTTFRPGKTATCRPPKWVQRISEGWTGRPALKDADSGDSSLHGPSSSPEEEIIETWVMNGGFLPPFDLPGVRHPTDVSLTLYQQQY